MDFYGAVCLAMNIIQDKQTRRKRKLWASLALYEGEKRTFVVTHPGAATSDAFVPTMMSTLEPLLFTQFFQL